MLQEVLLALCFSIALEMQQVSKFEKVEFCPHHQGFCSAMIIKSPLP